MTNLPLFTVIGWVVIHSVWLGALIAATAALALSLMSTASPRTRGRVAGAALVLMVAAPIWFAMAVTDPFEPVVRRSMSEAVTDTIALSTILAWRSFIVRAAAGLWIAGFVVSAARVVVEWRRAQRLRRDARGDAGEAVRAVVSGLRVQLSVGAAVDVRGSTRASVPMVLGWRRPIILLPLSAVRVLRADQLRAVLAHELAHVRCGDYFANMWQLAVESVLVHHPGAWWLSRRIRTEREYCCDDVAVQVGGDVTGYARALAALDDARGECRLAVAAGSGTLLDRIRRIAGEARPTLTPLRAIAALLVTSIVAGVILACAMIIPPSIPLDAQLRSRSPAPPGARLQAPPQTSLPRSKTQR